MTKVTTLMLAAGLAAAAPAFAQTSTDTVRAQVAEMMADAETRSSLLAAGDAGHDGRFFIAGDGFRLNIGGQIQFRYVLNFRDDENNGDDFSNGFQTRRTKLDFNGEIRNDWFFRVLGAFDREGGSFASKRPTPATSSPTAGRPVGVSSSCRSCVRNSSAAPANWRSSVRS